MLKLQNFGITKYRAVDVLIGFLLVFGAAFAYFKFLNTEEVEPLDSSPETVYQNDTYGFSFQYPDGFKISEFADDGGDVVLADGDSSGFQIFISEFDESGPVTTERVRADLPNIEILQSQNIEVSGASMLIFFSQDPSLGKTREAWFVWPPEPYPNGNYLYQITSAAEFDEELSKIMATWKFQ